MDKKLFLCLIIHLWSLVFVFDAASAYSLAPESFGEGTQDDLVDWSSHPCKRECRDDEPSLTCRYAITVERYASMSHACYRCPFVPEDCYRPHCVPADGNDKALYVANRKMPGLLIEVCKGDRLIVDVTNRLGDESTSIHWHGIHQRGTPFMDGVPHITQCPILPGETFRYDFMADMAGTFFWHSHSGTQRVDGLYGSIIIRPPPKENKVKPLYDRDVHVMIVTDWYKRIGSSLHLIEYHNGIKMAPHTILINGMGRYDGELNETRLIPRQVFEVEQGYRYRFRIIQAGIHNCPTYVSIDGHSLQVISVDGADVEPLEVDSIRMTSSERYDFVLTANRKVSNYYIRVVGDNNCELTKSYQLAILRYAGAPVTDPSGETRYNIDAYHNDISKQLNPLERGTETDDTLTTMSLNSLDDDDASLSREPDYQFHLTYTANLINDKVFFRKELYDIHKMEKSKQRDIQRINYINFKMPKFPLQTQPEMIRPNDFCNESTVATSLEDFQACTHVLQVKLGSIVELITIDDGTIPIPLTHPMHLHGMYYRVVAMEKVNKTLNVDEVKKLDKEGKINRRLRAAPFRDSAVLPRGGYSILRFHANNPGYWFFHCHYDMHLENGMALVFKVGEHSQFPKVPKNFPKCGR